MSKDSNPGSAVSESKIDEVTKSVESADDLLKLAQAKRILDKLERPEKSVFPWENVLKFSSVAVGALVGAVILVTSGITDNFWDAYNFAKEAKTAREGELAATNTNLGAAKMELQSLQGQLGDAVKAKEVAETARQTAVDERQVAMEQRDSALSEIEAARIELLNLEDEVELARISSVRMYMCDRNFTSEVFDELSLFHGWPRFNLAVASVPSPEVYLSVQFIGDNSFQYVSNIRSRSEERRVDTRTEFGRWRANPSSVEIEYTMSKRGRPSVTITGERFSRGQLAAYARGDTDRVCSDRGACFHRNSTCRPERE